MSAKAEDYRVPKGDLPDGLKPLVERDAVDKIIEYQSPYAQYSVLLSEGGRKQEIRVYYLEELRGTWEWVDGTDDGTGFVLLKRRTN